MMTNKRKIVSIAHLGLAWGLKETRALLESQQGLKDNVKVVFMKLEGVKEASAGVDLVSPLLAKVLGAVECQVEGEEKVEGLDPAPVHRDVQKAAHLF